MSASAEEWKETVKSLLSGINRYNPVNIDTLERYVQFQCESEEYDFEANLTLMKLYQFQPSRSNVAVVLQILLKALLNLPQTDFIMLKAVIPQPTQHEESTEWVLELHHLLESCQFKDMWSKLGENDDVIAMVPNFETSIRNYICSVIDTSYQNISADLLKTYLGGVDDDVLDAISAGRGWEGQGESVHIRQQEELIKPKKILAKIDFDSVSGIMVAAAR